MQWRGGRRDLSVSTRVVSGAMIDEWAAAASAASSLGLRGLSSNSALASLTLGPWGRRFVTDDSVEGRACIDLQSPLQSPPSTGGAVKARLTSPCS